MSNPFKKIADNARETAKKWENTKAQSTLHTIACPRCGAPRPVNTNLGICDYCQHQFMDVKVMVTRKHDEA